MSYYNYYTYKGCLIIHKGNIFQWNNHSFPTLYLAKKKIDLALIHLQNSIHKQNLSV
jgi:hypothetical protein